MYYSDMIGYMSFKFDNCKSVLRATDYCHSTLPLGEVQSRISIRHVLGIFPS